jgi:hypothetical protein
VNAEPESLWKKLRKHGMDLVKIMEEMVKNNEYGKLTGSGNNTLENPHPAGGGGLYRLCGCL